MFLRAAVYFAVLFFGVGILHGQSPWGLRNQRPGGDDLWGISSGPGGLVAVGTNGAILQSPDGQTWTRRSSGTTDWLTAVTYGNGRYIAVGDHGHILISVDGATWTTVSQTATTQRLNNVAFAQGLGPDDPPPYPAQNRFMAVGESGTILSSVDGTTWTARPSGTTNWLRGLALGIGYQSAGVGVASWVAAGQAGTLLISDDGGITWRNVPSGTNVDLEAIAFVSGYHSHPVAGPGGGSIVFCTAGQGGLVQSLVFAISDGISPRGGTGTATTIPLNTSARIRCLVSGPSNSFTSLGSAVESATTLSPPVLAVDESATVFSAYNFDNTYPLTVSSAGLWRRDTVSSPGAIRAGCYSAVQNSFFVVGQNETVLQRDQVFNGRLGNISARGFVDQGEKALIAGFVVTGATPKRVLVRGVGPSLGNFGVVGVLARPSLIVYDSAGNRIATNSGWDTGIDSAAIAGGAAQAGAFPLSAGSGDSALLITLAPGKYTAQVAGINGAAGVALIEVYDLDDHVSGTSRAINLSTRGQVSGGENALIAGINVQSPGWRTFLVRGVGPSLARFGIANALQDPKVDVSTNLSYPQSVGSTSDFAQVSVPAATSAVGAFALDANSQDYARVFTLPPGNYTFLLSSKSNSSGIALIEIYEVGIAQ